MAKITPPFAVPSNLVKLMPVGSMTYLVGHSGAGKSTLLKLIMGMERANGGQIWFNGHDITRLSRHEVPFLRRQIGMVHQDYRLLSDRSVLDNVALPLIIAGQHPKDANSLRWQHWIVWDCVIARIIPQRICRVASNNGWILPALSCINRNYC